MKYVLCVVHYHQRSPAVLPEEGKISKFKPDITFNKTESLESFLFALDQSLAAYNLNSNHNRKLALGRSLRGDTLEWWTDNATLLTNQLTLCTNNIKIWLD